MINYNRMVAYYVVQGLAEWTISVHRWYLSSCCNCFRIDLYLFRIWEQRPVILVGTNLSMRKWIGIWKFICLFCLCICFSKVLTLPAIYHVCRLHSTQRQAVEDHRITLADSCTVNVSELIYMLIYLISDSKDLLYWLGPQQIWIPHGNSQQRVHSERVHRLQSWIKNPTLQ